MKDLDPVEIAACAYFVLAGLVFVILAISVLVDAA